MTRKWKLFTLRLLTASKSCRKYTAKKVQSVLIEFILRTTCQCKKWWIHQTDNEWRISVIQELMKKSKWCSRVKKLQVFSTRLESQKLLNVLNNKNDYKIWIDMKVISNKLLWAMINSKAMNNYISYEAIQQLELILQWQWNSAWVYMTNTSSMIVWDYVHMKMIVRNVSQKLTFDILNIKYDAILEMLWLHNRNSKIDWVNKKLFAIKHTYKISEQSEMCLSEYKSWNHKILLLKKEQFKWMSLYLISENQLKKVWN